MGKLPAGSPTKNHHVLSIEDNSVHALEARRKVRKKSSGRFQDAGKTGSRVGTPPPTTNRGSHRILAGEEKSSEHSCLAGFLLAEDRGFELPLASTHVNADYDISPHSSCFECTKSKRSRAEKQLTTSKCTHEWTHGALNPNGSQCPSADYIYPAESPSPTTPDDLQIPRKYRLPLELCSSNPSRLSAL